MAEDERSRIREHLTALLRDQNDKAAFTDTTSLISTGRLDSMAVIQLVGYLETEFGVDFTAIEFDPQRFDTVTSLIGMVDEWRQAGR
jgi:acyl carrier protein